MNEININRGRSKTIRVPAKYKDGSICKLSGEDYIFFAVKASRDGEVLISKMLSYDSGSNKATLTLNPEDTAGLEVDRYFYDIGVCFSNGDYKDIIKWSEFNILPSAGGVELKELFSGILRNTSDIYFDDYNGTSKINIDLGAVGGADPYVFGPYVFSIYFDGVKKEERECMPPFLGFQLPIADVHVVQVDVTDAAGATVSKYFTVPEE